MVCESEIQNKIIRKRRACEKMRNHFLHALLD